MPPPRKPDRSPSPPSSRGARPPARRRAGFAVILVASLAALVALLGAALVSFLQVESAATQYDQRLRQARSNALVALEMAVGELQRHAGRDQVATALADGYRQNAAEDFKDAPNPAGLAQPFWTGAWPIDDDGAVGPPRWLVTAPLGPGAEAPDPFAFDEANSVVLVGGDTLNSERWTGLSHDPDFDVRVPREPIQTSELEDAPGQARTAGHYAYWVGDLSTKASLGIPDRVAEVSHAPYAGDETAGKLIRQQVVQTFAFEGVDPLAAAQFDQLLNEFQLREDPSSGAFVPLAGWDEARSEETFHDVAYLSRGVLTNALEGGLKKDLSALEATGDAFLDDSALPYANPAAYSATTVSDYERQYAMQADNTKAAAIADRSHPLHPVLTEFHIGFEIELNGSSDDAIPVGYKVRYGLSAEFWNPYTGSLVVSGAKLKFTLPNVAIKARNAAGETIQQHDLNLAAGGAETLVFLLPEDETILRPGEVQIYSGGSDLIKDANELGEKAELALPGSGDARLLHQSGSGTLDVDSLAFETREGSPLEPKLELIGSEGETLAVFKPSSDHFERLLESGADYATPFKFGFTWRVEDPGAGPWQTADIRNLENYGSFLASDSSDTTHSSNYAHTISDATIAELLGNSPSGSEPAFDMPLFEIPGQELLSVGQLRHAPARGASGIPQQLGKSVDQLGGTPSLNGLFDQYFFSTASSAWADSGGSLAVSRYRPYEYSNLADLVTSDSAQYLLLEGAFNVNSTSIDAWESLLKGARFEGWEAGFAGEDLLAEDVPFLHYSQSAQQAYAPPDSDSESASALREPFRNGLVALTDLQVETLGEEIVRGIREKIGVLDGEDPVGVPFASLQEFVDSGALQAAIDAVDQLGNEAESDELDPINPAHLQPYHPQYFDQADLLQPIAPYLTVRGDTFIARAYGDAVDPLAEDPTAPEALLARAYCEAVVQRLPQKHPSDGNAEDAMAPTTTGEGELGREFRIVAFRWITPEQL